MPNATLTLTPQDRRYKLILDALLQRHKVSQQKMSSMHARWRKAEEKFTSFIPERDIDAERRLKRDNEGELEYRTIVLPYSYAQLMSAHTYWTTVFLARTPVFQFSGRHGESMQQTQAMEALIDYQRGVGGMLPVLFMWLLDIGKYGVGVLGNFWAEEQAIVTEIVEEPQLSATGLPVGNPTKRKITSRVPGYVGNKLYNIRPYNLFPDPRVPINRFQEGEFIGVYAEIGWNEILRRRAQGAYVNVELLKEAQQRDASVDQGSQRDDEFSLEIPDVVENALPTFGATDQARNPKNLREANFYGLYDFYVELVPKEWGLGETEFPEKWVFTTSSDFKVLLSARPLGAHHNKFPLTIVEFEPEAYALFNRSFLEVINPIQHTMDWLINSHFYNVRKALNDQFVVNPSRVVMKDLQDPTPGGIIRLKPSAYIAPISDVIAQLPVADITRAHIDDMETMNQWGQRATGVNDQIMGQLNAGGRRTATETRQSSTFAINRLKTVSEWFSMTGFEPLSQMLVQNSQQYYDGERKFRIVGDLVVEAGEEFIDVTPESILGFYDFVPIDGTLPVDRFAQANLWRAMLNEMSRVPPVMAQYDLGRIFAWVAQLAGLKNINQFRTQVVPDAALAQAAQAGNVVPVGQATSTQSLEPGQIEGLGQTG